MVPQTEQEGKKIKANLIFFLSHSLSRHHLHHISPDS